MKSHSLDVSWLYGTAYKLVESECGLCLGAGVTLSVQFSRKVSSSPFISLTLRGVYAYTATTSLLLICEILTKYLDAVS
jgi:hypothetical protein